MLSTESGPFFATRHFIRGMPSGSVADLPRDGLNTMRAELRTAQVQEERLREQLEAKEKQLADVEVGFARAAVSEDAVVPLRSCHPRPACPADMKRHICLLTSLASVSWHV